VDRFGRRILLIVSGTFMSLSLAGLGVFFYIKSLWESQGADEALEAVAWMPLLCLIAFIVAYSSGYSAVPYVVMGELFPIRYRNVLSAVSTSFNLSCSFVVVRTFPDISRHLGFDLAFWFYGICCAAGVVFVLLILPETKGRTLEDISRLFSGKNDTADAGTQETCLQIIASPKD
jgi:facilitated trehalose transporter